MIEIGILGAMEEEIVFLREKMSYRKKHMIGEYEFWTGRLEGFSVVLSKCGTGKVNATINTTLMHQQYKPSYILHIGSAGGIQDSLKVGDVIIATEIRYHDVDLTPFGYEYGQASHMPISFKSNPEFVKIAYQQARLLEDINPITGLIVSGDSFIHSKKDIQKIRERFPEALAVEMEAGAIAQTCYKLEIPFLVICSLSDKAQYFASDLHTETLKLASQNATVAMLSFLKKLNENISR